MKRNTIPRLGSPRIDEALIAKVRTLRATGITDVFWTSDSKGRQVKVERKSDADLYQRIMAAKGVAVLIGPQ
jgi:hypothetical protein